MKLFIASCLLALLALGDSLKCYTGDGSKDPTSGDCDSGVTKCYGPKLMLKGYDGEVRGCGDCPSSGYTGTCESCDKDDCNKMMELVDAYKCYTYTYDESTKKVSEPSDKNVQQCKLKKGDDKTKKTCVMMIPAENQKAADYGKGGCGVCPEKSEKTCKECEGNMCKSSAVNVTLNLVTLFAIIKSLF